MQSGKNAMESMKESAANVAASAKSGMEKTKATVQEKVEKITAKNPMEKEIAREKKEEKIAHAELGKLEAREHNLTAKEAAKAGAGPMGYTTATTTTHSTTGTAGHPTGAHQMPALPGHGTGQPAGQVIEGVVGAHPIGTNTGTDRTSAAHNTRAGGTGAQGYGTGGYYG